MLQMCRIYMPGNAQDPELLYDTNIFKNWCQECANILMKAKDIEKVGIVITGFDVGYNTFDCNIGASFPKSDGTETLRIGKMSVYYTDLLNIFHWDEDGNLDITALTDEKMKEDLYKYLLKRIWQWYKYSLKWVK